MPGLGPAGSVLALLHPTGGVATVRVIGNGPSPASPSRLDGGIGSSRADLIILAPSGEDDQRDDWLKAAVQEAGTVLAEDGVLYVRERRSSRRETTRLLRREGLVVEGRFLHHPGWDSTGLLIPIERRAIAHAFSHLIHTNRFRRTIALALLRLPGVLQIASRLLPEAGVAARRPGGAPLFGWLNSLSMTVGLTEQVVIQTSWRGPDGAILLHHFAAGEEAPRAIVKIWLRPKAADSFGREVAALTQIAPQAAAVGARVPRLLGQGDLKDGSYLVETRVSGQKAADLLQREPRQLVPTLTRLVNWLEQWHRATAQPRPLTRQDVERYVLQPLAELEDEQGRGEARGARLAALSGKLVDRPLTFVAAHHDLTMANVLTEPGKALGVIDWETAVEAGLPLVDFFYAAVDAVAATNGYADRLAAFRACFAQDGAHRKFIEQMTHRLSGALGLNEDIVAFCFQACWLQYALAERHETAKKRPHEFLRIAAEAAQPQYVLPTRPSPVLTANISGLRAG